MYRFDYSRMLMSQIAAFGQTAHVQIIMAVGVPEMCAPSSDDGGRLPLGRHTPTVQNAIALADHRGSLLPTAGLRFDNRTIIRIAHYIRSHYPLPVNQFIEASFHGPPRVVHR